MKKLTDLSISTKLKGGFGIVALLCALVGGVGWYGLNTTMNGVVSMAEVRLPSVESLGQMTARMNEIRRAENSMINPNLTNKERQERIERFAGLWQELEKWYAHYAPLARNAEEEQLWQQFQSALVGWKAEHKKLVELTAGARIDRVGGVEAMLAGRQLDHVKWAAALDKAIATNSEFKGILDPTQCGLGKWLAGYKSGDAGFDAIIARFHEPHNKLHELGGRINELIGHGKTEEARENFDKQVTPVLQAILAVFGEALTEVKGEMERINNATEMAFGSERKAYTEALKPLDELSALSVKLADEVSHQAQTTASRSKLTATAAMLLAVALAVAFGLLLSRGISHSLHAATEVIRRIGLGDAEAARSIAVGTPVNCSASKNCGNTSCPSFGRVDACWVTSGSFTTVKHCPRAQKGEDCRSCNLYGARTELEELGSIIAGLARGLGEREELALAIARGDLTRKVELASDRDSLGKALQAMLGSLRKIIGEVKTAGEQIAIGSSQVSDASQSLSQGATESAASIEQITASMNEMAGQTKLNAENAAQANQLSNQAKAAAEGGNVKMQEMIRAMGEISESSQNISKIIKVIDEIAFQTNLLALNAAVEAARAGKHGKGFAVVAEEVRNLAARSAKAARETAELIEGSVAKTHSGAEIANRTAESLVEIVAGVTKVSDLVAEIAAASNEQAEGIAQVNLGLGQIDQVTQQNTANAEQGAAAAEELSGQAAQMKEMLSRFSLNGNGRGNRDNGPGRETAVDGQRAVAVAAGAAVERGQRHPAPHELIALDDAEFGKY